jgi:ribonuclease HI
LLYAEAMKAIYEDNFLDEKGNIITNKKQKEWVTSTRKKYNTNQELDSSFKSSAAKDAVSVVKEIREAQNTLSSRFQESSTNMEEEIAAAIGALLDTVQDSFTTMERLGSSILVELEKTEQEVAQAWGKKWKERIRFLKVNTFVFQFLFTFI